MKSSAGPLSYDAPLRGAPLYDNRRVALATASAGPLLVLLAFTVPLTTLTTTGDTLGAGPGAQAWFLSAMSVGTAAGLLSSGAVGDDYGRRRAFVVGAIVLAATSLLAALATTPLVFVIARILQGLGGAAIMACSLGIVGQLYPANADRARATGVWAAALGAGVAIGPLLSAGLDHLAGWRTAHLLTAAGAGVLAVAAARALPESRAERPRRIDVVGTLLLGVGLTAVLAGLTEIRSGPGPNSIALLAGGALLLVGFVVAEHRSREPMLDLELFRRPDFVAATAASLATGAGVLSLVSFVPTLLERAADVSVVLGGTLLLAWSATSVLTAFGARWLPNSMTPHTRLIVGLISVAVGQLILYDPVSAFVRLLVGMFVAGFANGVLNAALGHEAVATVPSDRTAMGSGVNNTARYVGSATGLTIVAVLVAHGGSVAGTSGLIAGWNIAVIITAGFSLAGAALVGFIGRSGPGDSFNPSNDGG